MPRVVQLAAVLPAPPERLYDMYLDPAAHAAFTGAPVAIDAQPGSEFRAFDGMLAGRTLQVVPKRLIVQAWRSARWGRMTSTRRWSSPSGPIPPVDASSSCTSTSPTPTSPASARGWEKYYWTPWRAYLERSG